MTDLHDMQTRPATATGWLQMRIENDRLAKENTRLKQIVEQLLARESNSEDVWYDELNCLGVKLNVLLELLGDERAMPDEDLGMGWVRDAARTGADAGELGGVVSCEADGPSPGESGSLSNIWDRVGALSTHIRADDGQTDAPRSDAEGSGSGPEPMAHVEPGESFERSTSQNQVFGAVKKRRRKHPLFRQIQRGRKPPDS